MEFDGFMPLSIISYVVSRYTYIAIWWTILWEKQLRKVGWEFVCNIQVNEHDPNKEHLVQPTKGQFRITFLKWPHKLLNIFKKMKPLIVPPLLYTYIHIMFSIIFVLFFQPFTVDCHVSTAINLYVHGKSMATRNWILTNIWGFNVENVAVSLVQRWAVISFCFARVFISISFTFCEIMPIRIIGFSNSSQKCILCRKIILFSHHFFFFFV